MRKSAKIIRDKKLDSLIKKREKLDQELDKAYEVVENIEAAIEQIDEEIAELDTGFRLNVSYDKAILVVLLLCLVLYAIFGYDNSPKAQDPSGWEFLEDENSFFRTVPGGDEVYRSQQPNAEQLEQLLATGRVEHVLRLNGDGTARERGALSHQEEERICEKYGVEFTYLNIDAYGAGSEGYEYTMGLAQDILERGYVLTHCRNNMHRNGAVIGRFMRSHGYTDAQIINHNNWEQLSADPGKYARYIQAALN